MKNCKIFWFSNCWFPSSRLRGEIRVREEEVETGGFLCFAFAIEAPHSQSSEANGIRIRDECPAFTSKKWSPESPGPFVYASAVLVPRSRRVELSDLRIRG